MGSLPFFDLSSSSKTKDQPIPWRLACQWHNDVDSTIASPSLYRLQAGNEGSGISNINQKAQEAAHNAVDRRKGRFGEFVLLILLEFELLDFVGEASQGQCAGQICEAFFSLFASMRSVIPR